MKPGQEAGDVNSAFTNNKFFRQAEVSEKARNAMRSKYYDSTMQHMMEYFCEAITNEINEARTL